MIMNNINVKKKKQFVPNVFKLFVALGSMLGTLGIWTFLANKDLQQVNGQGNAQDQPQTNYMQTPLPTLVPLHTVEITASGVTVDQPAANLPLREVTQPASTTSVNPPSNTNPVIIPAPVTTTRSSRP
jgi:hypothetical protein